VDDAEMGVTHILRGQEHTLNTFLHVALQDALGYARPTYGHLPIIMNMDGSKMGKRDRDKLIRKRTLEYLAKGTVDRDYFAAAAKLQEPRLAEWLSDSQKQLDIPEQSAVMKAIGMKPYELPEILVHDFRKNGYLPEALLNFLALLGWNPGGDRERMSVAEMVQLFGADGIGKSNAKFDRTKLVAFNTKAAEEATPDRLLAAFKDFLSVNPDSPLNAADDEALAKLLHMKKGFRTLREVEEACRFFFVPDDQIAYEPDAVEKVLKKNDNQGLNALRDVRQILADATEWAAPALESAVKQYCERTGLGLGKVAQPIRVAVSGGTVSPPMFESLELLGRERTLSRIDRCLKLTA
jgi:glutamyl-tRNA synthetase